MKIRTRHNSDGIALIMVMCAIVVLSALAAAFAYSMKVEARLAQNANDEEQLLWLGRSGVEYCRWVLAQEKCPYDSLNQKWAGGSGSECDTNLMVENPVQVGDGTFTWKIFDLERKVNINTAIYPANSQMIIQALTLMEVDANEISVVSDSILDWIGPAGPPRAAGAESDYYQGLIPPYYAKNAPIDDLSELKYIKGVTEEIYSGHSTNQPVFHHKLGLGTAPGQASGNGLGLTNFFTPFSSGKININTADRNVLRMIPGAEAMVDAIIKQRDGPDGVPGTEDDIPFQNAGQLAAITGVNPGPLCDVHSFTYEVHVTAQIGDSKRDYTAILARTSATDIQVLSFYWK
jgi:general secretion pathway protein K